MTNFCLVCLNVRTDELVSFTEVIDGKPIIEKLKIISPEIIPDEIKRQKSICRVCIGELNVSLGFKEKYNKGYSNFKFYFDKLQNQVTSNVELDEVKIEEDVIDLEEDEKVILQDLLSNEEDAVPVEEEPTPVENQFPCFKCSAVLPNIKSLKHHEQIHEVNTPIIKATTPVNRKRAATVTSDRDFSSRHLRAKKETANWRFCPEGTNCERLNDNTNNSIMMCPTCSKDLWKNEKLQKHVCEPIECPQCLRKFASQSNLDKHAVVHKRMYNCPKCSKRFTTENFLKEHFGSHENTNEIFNCETCEKAFDNQKSLKLHSVTHNRHCRICSLNLKSKKDLELHNKISH